MAEPQADVTQFPHITNLADPQGLYQMVQEIAPRTPTDTA